MISLWLTSIWVASIRGGSALLVAWILCHIPRVPAAVRCWIWRASYVVLLTAFVWSTPVKIPLLRRAIIVSPQPAIGKVYATPQLLPRIADPDLSGAIRSESDTAPTVSVPPPPRPVWPIAAFSMWIAFLACYGGRLARDWHRARLLRRGDPVEVRALIDLCRAMNIRRQPAVRIHPAVRGPLLVGLWRPTIVLPKQMVADLRPILAHELAHLRRLDLLWNWLPTVALAILPFHPLVWICNRQWRLATEAACDAETLAVTAIEPVEYGRLLVKVAAAPPPRTAGVLAVAVATESRWLLKQRLTAMANIAHWNRRRLATAGLIVGVFAVVAAVPWHVVAQQATPPTTGPVLTTNVTRPPEPSNTAHNYHLPGTIVVTTATVRTSIRGTVNQVAATVGQAVKRGDVLVQLDQTTAKVALTQANAKAAYADKDFQLTKQAQQKGKGIVSELDYTLKQSQSELAQGEVAQAQHELDATNIVAPFDGIVARCEVQPGDVVDPHQEMVTVLQSGPPQVEFDLPQEAVGQVNIGTVVSAEYRNLSVTGKVTVVSPMLDPQTRTQAVTAQLVAGRPEMLPGMFVQVSVNPPR